MHIIQKGNMMSHGGARIGAGRPKESGQYKEKTMPIRIPISRFSEIQSFLQSKIVFRCPLYGCKVMAGFPSPADDYIEAYLDLNQHLISHPSATFFVRASGDSMKNIGIMNEDLLVVDRSITPSHGRIVIAAVNGELTVKRFYSMDGKVKLLPENDNYLPISINETMDFFIWGVLIHNIRSTF